MKKESPVLFPGTVDLAAERIGARALYATDDFFAPKENLLKPGRGIFIPEKFTSRGKWMDGWESRRKRVPGHDFCIIRLGLAGVLKGVDIDTNHFVGNHPPFASLEAAYAPGASLSKLKTGKARWAQILKKSPLKPGSQNIFRITDRRPWTHLKLHIFPDGGVARLRAYGEGRPNPRRFGRGDVDLASILNGGCVTLTNDMFFGPKDNLIMPGRGKNMGDGWETRRKRGPGHDWVIVRLGRPGTIDKIEVDTNHFKGNFPDRCSIEGCRSGSPILTTGQMRRARWTAVLPETKLRAHRRQIFKTLLGRGPFTHIRLCIYPDGGVSRLRIIGRAC